MLPILLPPNVIPKPAAPCSTCVGRCWSRFGDLQGYVPPSGSGANGVLIVAEAAGAEEEVEGVGLIGKAGYYLFTQLKKVDLEREDFRLANVLACRPPNNKLAGESYEAAATASCAPLLDAEIRAHVSAAEGRGQTPVILALGKSAWRRLSGWPRESLAWKYDYQAYVHRSEKYGCYIVAADHPSYLMRGQHQYVPVLQYAAQRAVEVAAHGFTYDEPRYLCDPQPDAFAGWVRDYFAALDSGDETFLSVDIETPTKQKKDEEALAREEDDDYIILRVGFAFRPGAAVSIPWRAEYMASLETLLGATGNRLVTWNGNYDLPRLRNQLTVRGENHDAMLAWHVLNSALDKRLGFVTPFYVKNARMWKHISGDQPAWYNACDADMALRNYLGIRADLKRAGQVDVFNRHIIELHKVTDHMSEIGLLRDDTMRADAEVKLTGLLTSTEEEMHAAIPEAARRERVYKKRPRNTEGILERPVRVTLPVCSACGSVRPTKAHARTLKKTSAARPQNPCAAAPVVQVEVATTQYYKYTEWKASTVQLKNYQTQLKHQAVVNRKENRVTFDEDAIRTLLRKYPDDPLYRLLLQHRKYQKLLGTYVGRSVYETIVVPDNYILASGEKDVVNG